MMDYEKHLNVVLFLVKYNFLNKLLSSQFNFSHFFFIL